MPEKIVQLNEAVIKGQIREPARGSAEETLNELLKHEAEQRGEAIIEMYPAGILVRRVEDITEALGRGSKVSSAAISELNKKACVHIEDRRGKTRCQRQVSGNAGGCGRGAS